MPGKRLTLPLILSTLTLLPIAETSAGWDCRADADGGWICAGSGDPLGTPPLRQTAPEPAEEPAAATPPPVTVTPLETETTPLPPPATAEPTAPVMAPAAQPAAAPVEPPAAASETAAEAATMEEPAPAGAVETEAAATTEPTVTAPVSEQAAAGTAGPMTESPTAAAVVDGSDTETADTTTPASSKPTTAQSSIPPADTEPATSTTAIDRTATEAADTTSPASSKPATAQPSIPPADAEPPTATASDTTDGQATSDSDALALIADANIDRNLDWAQCYPWKQAAPLSFQPAPAELMLVEADGSVLQLRDDAVAFEGAVAVRQGKRMLEAEQIQYAPNTEQLDAVGNVYFEQPLLRLSAASAHFELAKDQGDLTQVEYRLTDRGARGSAGSAHIESPQVTQFENITYSTCQPGNDAWQLEAEQLEIDRESGIGTARHAKLRFKGIPFAYIPYATFPIDDRRKSGFLLPSFGTGDRTGTDLSIPYYFNIAPNMDATLTTRLMSKRGLLLGGEFRYLQQNHKGEIRAEIIPDDQEVADNINGTRGAFSYQASGNPARRWSFDINANYVSDKDYLDDMGQSLSVTSARHLERRGDIRYRGEGWSFLGRTQYFQTIDDSIQEVDRPYSRLPQLLFSLDKRRQPFGLDYFARAEYVYFDHNSDSKVTGSRFDLEPGIRLPVTRPWGFITPKASLRYTKYLLNNQAAGLTDRPDRVTGTFSLDSGLFFERSTNWFDTALTQTLEPRLFYLLTPYQDQSELPDFDSATRDFSFANLFRENRFTGGDRVGDANQLTAALTSRTLSDLSGIELFRVSIGQIYYFRDRDVTLGSASPATTSSSPMVAEMAARMGRDWRTRASIQWNPHNGSGKVEKSAFSLLYRDRQQRIASFSYRFTDGSVEQTDLSGKWPINHQVSLVGRWLYSTLYSSTMEALAGIEYDACCWRVRLAAQRLQTNIDNEPKDAIYLQFELKGLTSIGDRIDDLLEKSIRGYRAE